MSTPLSPAIGLREFNSRLAAAVNDRPALTSVWVVAETADLRVSGGHCYMELIEKDPAGFTDARAVARRHMVEPFRRAQPPFCRYDRYESAL